MDNCNKWQKRKLQKLAKRMYKICFDFTRRYFEVSLFTPKIAKIYCAKFGEEKFHLLFAMETAFSSCNGVFSKAQGLRYSKLCLNPDIFRELKEPEHQEKYISLPVKTGRNEET